MCPEFNKHKTILLPREVLAGSGVLSEVASVATDLGLGKTALVVTGPNTNMIAGKMVCGLLEDARFDVASIEVVESSMKNVEAVKVVATEMKAEFLVAVGGGSKIDVAKLVAQSRRTPLVSIPTSAAHDGIASPKASVKSSGTSLSVDAVMPIAVIADTSVLVKAPFRLLAAGCADVIANTTALKDWEMAHRLRGEEFSMSAAALSSYTAETIMANAGAIRPNLEESVWIAIKPILVSGVSMSVAGSSRPTSGSEHMFSHSLDRVAPGKALHGEQCGVGTIMMMYLHGGDWQRIRTALSTIGAPTTARELGVSSDQVIEALVHAHDIRPDRYTILGDRGLTSDAAERIARITGVI